MELNDPSIPGGDVSLAEIFRNDPAPAQPTTAPVVDPSAVTAQPQATPEPTPAPTPDVPKAFEISTRTGTVYKTVEDAVQGIEQKDTLINQLRSFAIERTGIDPVTGRVVSPQGQPQYAQPQADSYLNNPDKYFQDLYNAYQKNDPQAYFATQQKLVQEKMNAEFEPVRPLIQNMAKQSAIQNVSNDVPEFNKFIGSDDYKATLQAFPTLARGIEIAEKDFNLSQQLPDLYKMAYQLGQARKLPELIKQQQPNTPTPQTPRPLATPTRVPPPPTGNQFVGTSPNVDLTNSDVRKSVIEQFEQSGKADGFLRRV